jgi:hypothetical protein
MATFTIKRDDRLPVLQATLRQNVGETDESAIDLTTASAVLFKMRNRDTGELKIDAAASVVTPAAGVVSYAWAAGDTDTEGAYDSEFEVSYGAGVTLTVPNDGYDLIVITADLA